jgi:hypothetical protein
MVERQDGRREFDEFDWWINQRRAGPLIPRTAPDKRMSY